MLKTINQKACIEPNCIVLHRLNYLFYTQSQFFHFDVTHRFLHLTHNPVLAVEVGAGLLLRREAGAEVVELGEQVVLSIALEAHLVQYLLHRQRCVFDQRRSHVPSQTIVKALLLQESEELVQSLTVELRSGVLAQQVLESHTDEAAHGAAIHAEFLDDFGHGGEPVLREDVTEAVFRHVPLLEFVVTVDDLGRHLGTQSLDEGGVERDGSRVGVGIHTVGTGQHALEDGDAVRDGLTGLLRHAVESHQAAFLDGLDGSRHVVLGTPDQDKGVFFGGMDLLAELTPHRGF